MNKRFLVRKYAFLIVFLSTLIFCMFSKFGMIEAFAFSGSGAGTSASPYEITTRAQLEEVKNNLSAYYKLVNNIDLGNVEWTPIGAQKTPFTGIFDGNGYIISNLQINKGTVDYIGLFGNTNNATITNVKLINVSIKGRNMVGGLVGNAAGKTSIKNSSVSGSSMVNGQSLVGGLLGGSVTCNVEGCSSNANVVASGNGYAGGLIGKGKTVIRSYATGNVTGKYSGGLAGLITNASECYATGNVIGAYDIGGLIGYVEENAKISNCFALGNVTSTNSSSTSNALLGGLLGYGNTTSKVTNCYSAGVVTGIGHFIGGLFDNINNSNSVTNCYYDGIASRFIPQGTADFSKLTSGMKSRSTFIGWDFTNVWDINEGASYPYLRNVDKPAKVYEGLPTDDVSGGVGTESDPYIISTLEQFNNVKYDLNGYYKLSENIDIQNSEWQAIGTKDAPFTGVFDGNGHAISNLTITKETVDYIGLFGNTNNATITNVKLINVSIKGRNMVGGLVGNAAGKTSIKNSSVSGSSMVNGQSLVGGLLGGSVTCNVEGCSSNANVVASGNGYAGGLIGKGKTVIRSYATGNVTGKYSGGLAGLITNASECYATGNVIGAYDIGGLIGYVEENAKISNCFALGNVTSTNSSSTSNALLGGLLGYGNTTSKVTNCYSAGVVTGIGHFIGGLFDNINNSNLVNNCYFDSTVTGFTTPTTQTRTTDELMHQATYVNWDFTNIWHIIEGGTYAYLRELPNPHHYEDTQAPTVPQNLKVLSKTLNSITVSWDTSTDNIGVAGYKIYRDGQEIGTSTTNQYTDTGLKDGTTYIYTVKAFDYMGNMSLPSNEVTATTELNVPLRLTIDLPERIHVNNPLNFSTNPVGVGTVIWTMQKDGIVVDIKTVATANLDKNGGSITFKVVGNYTLIANVTDSSGNTYSFSDTIQVYSNNPPTTPIITMNPNTSSVAPGTLVTIDAISTDPDGDTITYVWVGRPAQQSVYPIGKNTIKVKAVDSSGAESAWAAIEFFVADETHGGGVVLTGPESTIIEEGIEGATIIEYTFTVPSVDGHSGDDYGRVKGFNKITGVWEQIDLQNTANGITMFSTLPVGKYTKLEFYYYTSHDCMYNKSNITYSVKYSFESGILDSSAPRKSAYTVKADKSVENRSEENTSPGIGIDIQAPTEPQNLTNFEVTATTSSAIVLSWGSSTDNVKVEGYKIFRNGKEIGTSATTNFTDIDVTAGTTYIYTIKAYDATGNISDESATLSVITREVQNIQVPIVLESQTPE